MAVGEFARPRTRPELLTAGRRSAVHEEGIHRGRPSLGWSAGLATPLSWARKGL